MKRIAAVLVLIVSVIIASLIVFSSADRGVLGILSTTESGGAARFDFSKERGGPSYTSDTGDGTTNLTDTLTQAYLEEIVRRNPRGPQLVDDISQLTVPTEETFQALLSSYLNASFEWNRITEKDIKISDPPGPVTAYLESVRGILDEKTRLIEKEAIALSDFLEKGNDASLRKAIEELRLLLGEILVISSPPEHKEFHLRLANFLQRQIAIYDAILKANDDPVRAVLAINEFPDTGQELENLRAILE